jgi:VWFA-related protein
MQMPSVFGKYLVLCIALSSSADGLALKALAQTKAKDASDAHQIKVKTELMEVRAVVTDRKGQIVEGLKKDDFEVFEDAKPQEIGFFSISQVESGHRQASATEPWAQASPDKGGRHSQPLQTRLTQPPVRTTLLYVDNLHMSFRDLAWVKQALHRFVRERLTDQDLVALATSSGTLGIAQQFTRDRQLLNYAIEQIRLGPIRDEGLFTPVIAAQVLKEQEDAIKQAVDLVRKQDGIDCPCDLVRSLARNKARTILSERSYSRKTTLSILKGFAEQMAGLPGKRMIVVFSDGFTLMDNDGDMHIEDIQPAISHAVRSGVVIYSIDAKGLTAPPTIDAGRNNANSAVSCPGETRPDPRCAPPSPGLLESFVSLSEQEELNAISAIANDTGGRLYTNSNDVLGSLGQAFDTNRFYYVLSYYLQPGGDPNRFRNIKVRVRNHPEYNVRTAKGFLPSDLTAGKEDDTGKTPRERLIRAMRLPLPVVDLEVSAQADYLETETDDKQVTVTTYFDGDRLQYRQQDQRSEVGLEILYAVFDAAGKQVQAISAHVEGSLTPERMEQAKTAGYRFSRRMALKPGVYQARVGIREDGTDRMGTASAWIEVPEPKRGKLEMSSLILRSPLDTDPSEKEGINVSELEQVRIVQGIPLYARGDECDFFFRANQGGRDAAAANLAWMIELLQDGKIVQQRPWLPVSTEEENKKDGKGWFDIDGELDLKGLDPGLYELRVSLKDSGLNKTIQRTAVFGVE